MADPDPIEDVNLRGDRALLVVQRPDGKFVPVQGSDAGTVSTTAEATGPGGEALATETTVDRTADAAEALAETIAPGGTVTPGQPVLAIVDASPPPTFAAAPSSGETLQAVYLAGAGAQKADREAINRYVVIEASAEELLALTSTIAINTPEPVNGMVPTAPRHVITGFRAGNVENPDLFGFTTAGSGTHGIHAGTRSQEIAVGGGDGAAATWQSHTKYPLPTQTAFAILGAVSFSDAGQPNQVRRIQLGDDTDYLGLEMSGTDVAIVGMSGLTGLPFSVPRENWFDPLDGTGPSGVTIDWTAFNSFEVITGVPGVSLGRATINGIAIMNLPPDQNAAGLLKHTEQPLRAVILNSGASSAGHLRIRGFAVHSVGDYKPQVYPTPAPLTAITRSVTTTGLPLISLRAKTTLGGQPWRGMLLPKTLDLSARGGNVRWQLVENPTALTGASWASGGAAVGLEYDVSATSMTLGAGRVIGAGTLASATDITRDLTPIFEEHLSHPIRVRTDGVSDILTLFVAATIGSADVSATFLVDVFG